jgi:hypothetical protein
VNGRRVARCSSCSVSVLVPLFAQLDAFRTCWTCLGFDKSTATYQAGKYARELAVVS